MHFKSTEHQIFFSVTALHSCSPALWKMSKRKSGVFWRRGRRFFYCAGSKAFFSKRKPHLFFQSVKKTDRKEKLSGRSFYLRVFLFLH